MPINREQYLPQLSKITHPTVLDIAHEYTASGVPDRVDDILSVVPDTLTEPLRYVFGKHVTKERPLTILRAGRAIGADDELSTTAAAAVDILWNSSIILDDVYDNDSTNAGMEPSSWAKYGKSRAVMGVLGVVLASASTTLTTSGPRSTAVMFGDLFKGVGSLVGSRRHLPSMPLEDLYANYDRRSSFYIRYPLHMIASGEGMEDRADELGGIQAALYGMNRAGQMINDLQDFETSDTRNRADSLSDVANGAVSVPISRLWSCMNDEEKNRMLISFGSGDLPDAESVFITSTMQKYKVAKYVQELIFGEYAGARDHYASAVGDSTEAITWIDHWIGYKKDQAASVVGRLNDSLDY